MLLRPGQEEKAGPLLHRHGVHIGQLPLQDRRGVRPIEEKGRVRRLLQGVDHLLRRLRRAAIGGEAGCLAVRDDFHQQGVRVGQGCPEGEVLRLPGVERKAPIAVFAAVVQSAALGLPGGLEEEHIPLRRGVPAGEKGNGLCPAPSVFHCEAGGDAGLMSGDGLPLRL